MYFCLVAEEVSPQNYVFYFSVVEMWVVFKSIVELFFMYLSCKRINFLPHSFIISFTKMFFKSIVEAQPLCQSNFQSEVNYPKVIYHQQVPPRMERLKNLFH